MCEVDSFSYPLCCINFIDLTQNTPTYWFWSHGDGSDYATVDSIHSHCYVVQGSYSVCLYTSNSSVSDTLCKPFYITVDSIGCYCDGDSILTGLNNNIKSDYLFVYPNPFSDQVTISFSENTTGNFIIRNSFGQLIYQEKFRNSLDLVVKLEESPGIYFLQVAFGEEIIFKKILKQ